MTYHNFLLSLRGWNKNSIFIIVFDISDYQSFERVQSMSWDSIRRTSTIVVGNKVDSSPRQVPIQNLFLCLSFVL